MKFTLKAIRTIFIFSILTVLTQVGGVIYLLYLPFSLFVKSEKYNFWKSIIARSLGYSLIYVLIGLFTVPPTDRALRLLSDRYAVRLTRVFKLSTV